jgi:hypothetical protein
MLACSNKARMSAPRWPQCPPMAANLIGSLGSRSDKGDVIAPTAGGDHVPLDRRALSCRETAQEP